MKQWRGAVNLIPRIAPRNTFSPIGGDAQRNVRCNDFLGPSRIVQARGPDYLRQRCRDRPAGQRPPPARRDVRGLPPLNRLPVGPRRGSGRTCDHGGRAARGDVGGCPAAPRAVALITTAGFWATCAAVAQPGRAAVSYVQARTPAPKELQVGGSKPPGGSSSKTCRYVGVLWKNLHFVSEKNENHRPQLETKIVDWSQRYQTSCGSQNLSPAPRMYFSKNPSREGLTIGQSPRGSVGIATRTDPKSCASELHLRRSRSASPMNLPMKKSPSRQSRSLPRSSSGCISSASEGPQTMSPH